MAFTTDWEVFLSFYQDKLGSKVDSFDLFLATTVYT